MLRTIPIWTMVLLAGLFLAGCKKEEAPQAAKPKVVQKKISLPASNTKGSAPAAHVTTAKNTVAATPKTAPAPKSPAAKGAMQKAPAASSKAGMAKAPPTSNTVPNEKQPTGETAQTPEALGNLITRAESIAAAAYKPRIYHPEGKIDPFMPLFRKEEAAPKQTATTKVIRREPKTPLEKLALSQLRLVAIMKAPTGRWGLVEENSGKGYVVKKGTYIGLNSGVVVAVKSDRIIIEEKVEDLVGKIKTIKKEMKINRPPGES